MTQCQWLKSPLLQGLLYRHYKQYSQQSIIFYTVDKVDLFYNLLCEAEGWIRLIVLKSGIGIIKTFIEQK